jgi:TRAP-type mannitol/chloroaromatic compound transport system substrate-binding protein
LGLQLDDCRPAIAQSMPELMAATWGSLGTLYGAAEYMARRIAELSENGFQIQVFAAGEIVPGPQVLDAVQSGTVEVGHRLLLLFRQDRPLPSAPPCRSLNTDSRGLAVP